MYIESSSPRRPGDLAVLQSGMFPPTQSTMCFSFWYHMFGNTIGTLRVLLQKSGRNATSIWELTGNQASTWAQGQVPVSSADSQYQVISVKLNGKCMGEMLKTFQSTTVHIVIFAII